jgi:hypothetical protein
LSPRLKKVSGVPQKRAGGLGGRRHCDNLTQAQSNKKEICKSIDLDQEKLKPSKQVLFLGGARS